MTKQAPYVERIRHLLKGAPYLLKNPTCCLTLLDLPHVLLKSGPHMLPICLAAAVPVRSTSCPSKSCTCRSTCQVRASHALPWTKKRTIPEIRGQKNAVPSCDIMLDDARSAQGKSRRQSRMTLPELIVRHRAWYHKIEQRSSCRKSRGWFSFFLSRVVHVDQLVHVKSCTWWPASCLATSQNSRPKLLLYSKKFSSAKNFVKSDRPAVRQEFIFIKRRSSLVLNCSSIIRSSLCCLSFIFTFLNISNPTLVVLWKI